MFAVLYWENESATDKHASLEVKVEMSKSRKNSSNLLVIAIPYSLCLVGLLYWAPAILGQIVGRLHSGNPETAPVWIFIGIANIIAFVAITWLVLVAFKQRLVLWLFVPAVTLITLVILWLNNSLWTAHLNPY